MSDTPLHDGPFGQPWQRWQMTSFDPVPPEPAALPEAQEAAGPDPAELLRQWRAEAEAQGRAQGHAQGHAEGLEAGLQQGQEQGWNTGHEAGLAAGLAEGRTQAREEAQRLATLATACAGALTQIEEKLGQDLLALALDIAGQVLRTTLQEQPESLLPALREVLQTPPASQGAVLRLWVHPDDLELVRQHLADELRDGNWRVLTDESIARGGCRAETPYGDIDATLQTRWRRVAASLGRNQAWEETA